MGLISTLFVLLTPASDVGGSAGRAVSVPGAQVAVAGLAAPAPQQVQAFDGAGRSWQLVTRAFRPEGQNQVRIEQRMTIRISPRPLPPEASLLMDLPQGEVAPRYHERRIGKCLPASNIAGVQVAGRSRLILFMRDRRMISASLERACRARDFYSGFYLERSSDGRLCVDRDTLLSRNGTNCRITGMHELVEEED